MGFDLSPLVTFGLSLTALTLPLIALSAGAEEPKAPKVAHPSVPVVLQLGDSFVNAGFRQALKPKVTQQGARYIVKAKHSLYIPTLPRALNVSGLMWNYRPSLVILNIGANELRMPHPSDHAGAVRRLSKLASMHGASCVWVTPPPPKSGQTGIVQVIKDNSAPCRVYDSSGIAPTLPRGFDHIHPTLKGGAMWADAFWTWLQKQRATGTNPWKLKPRPKHRTQKPPATPKSRSSPPTP